ncbi:MAG TPA: hypothetical protein VK700_02400 [Steroidobacteraceae bacterium]|jgi:hypothetical protein|nr:hypothetical protein [Steroidobacteraceae bacterium]
MIAQRSDEYRILSDEAVVVSGRVKCWNCLADVEVICLYCQTGLVDGEPTIDFSVSNVTRIDEALRLQLARWPKYHPLRGRGAESCFANHCPRCERPQDDFYLHCQPGGLFFSFQDPIAQELQVHALKGPVRLSGDEGFEP